MKVEYRDDNIAILTDFRSPYTALGDHPEWRPLFRRTIRHPATRTKLSAKLERFAPYVLCFTKIMPDRAEIDRLSGLPRATICVMSSIGEHGMTPWLVLHNIAHVIVSQNLFVKRDVTQMLGFCTDDCCIAPQQAQLVDCASARLGMIPNVHELIFELMVTWMWHGHTRSSHDGLREYGDRVFPELMEKLRGTLFWHKFRRPVQACDTPQPWLVDAVTAAKAVELPPVPGKVGKSKPGQFAPVVKERQHATV